MTENNFTEFEQEIIDYFTVDDLYKLVTFENAKGKTQTTRQACDVPMLEGFCGDNNMTLGEVEKLVSPRVLEICSLKQQNILAVNGLNKSYDSQLTGLILKNKHGYSEKVENTQRHEVILTPGDRRMLERAQIYELGNGKIIDVSDELTAT